jgi:hypothetical protein
MGNFGKCEWFKLVDRGGKLCYIVLNWVSGLE